MIDEKGERVADRAEELQLADRTVIVTGAGRGLGRAHALLLASRGANVVVNDLGGSLAGDPGAQTPADDVVAEIVAAGGAAVADGNDVSSPEGAAAIVDAAISAFGSIDAVVNNAGIVRDKSFGKMDAAAARSVVDVHFWGSFWLCQAAWPHFREQQRGRVVNTTSTAAYLGNFGQANYGPAKAALIGLTKTLAIEGERHGITVNAVAPAAATRMTEGLLDALEEHLDPALVSPLVAVLVHDDCPVSGEIFHAGAGSVTRVYFAQTRGIYDPALTPEYVQDNWDRLMDVADAAPAMGIGDELRRHGVALD